MHESEKWKWSRSVVSDSWRLHGLRPTRLLCPWDFPGKSAGVGCHHLLRYIAPISASMVTWYSLTRQRNQIKLPIFIGSQRKQGIPGKKPTSASLTMPKPLTLWITTNCGKFLQRWEYKTTSPVSCIQVKRQQLELHMEQQTGSKSRKEYIKVLYCHPAYITYIQSTPCEMLDWMKHKLGSRLQGEISQIYRWYHLMAEG